MPLHADNPELKEIVSAFEREKDKVTLAEVMTYEIETGNSLGQKLAASTNIIPVNKTIEFFTVLYEEFKNEIPSDKISSDEDALTFFRRIAYYAASRIRGGFTEEINDLFIVIELCLKDGTKESRKFIIAFLEDFQTIFFNEKIDFKLIKNKMHPLGSAMWREIDEYWQAAATYKKSIK